MAEFGSDGYQFTLTATDGGWHLSCYNQEYPELTADRDVTKDDLAHPELAVDDRANTDVFCKELIDKLQPEVHKLRESDAKASAKADREASDAEKASSDDFHANISNGNKPAEDGTGPQAATAAPAKKPKTTDK